MVIIFPAYDKGGKEIHVSTNDFILKIIDEGKETLVTELFDVQRAHAVADYLEKDAGVKPIFSPVFLIGNCDWPKTLGDIGGQVRYESITIENHEYFFPLVMIKNSKNDPSYENQTFAHEVLGHLGFDHYIYPEKRLFSHPLSEVFARTISMFLSCYRKEIIADACTYSGNTQDLVTKVLTLYPKIGKRAMVSLFYASKPEETPLLLERVCKEKEIVHSLAILATEYGNDTLQKIVTQPFEDIIKKSKQVYRDYSEHDLMLAHLNEFSLGEKFSHAYLHDLKPFSLEELIENKDVALFDYASELKWQYAHAATPIPSYERGMRLFDQMVSTLDHITELEGEYSPSCYVPLNFEAYALYFGRGDDLVNNFVKYGLGYADTGVLTSYDVSFIVAKRKFFSFLTSPFQAVKGFL